MEAYPLTWPLGYGRALKPKKSRFTTTLARARDFIKRETKAIHGRDLTISTNLPVNRDGELRADYERFKVADVGVAIYFTRNNNNICLCCDTYDKIRDNLHAIGRTLEGLRQIDRDGVSDFLNRTFTGFPALPEINTTTENDIWKSLGFQRRPADVGYVTSAYKTLAKEFHPDSPTGNHDAFIKLQDAYNKDLKLFS